MIPLDQIEHLEILYHLSRFLKVQSYLEIGVREGASLLSVLCKEPEVTDFVRSTLSDHRTRLTDELLQRVQAAFTLKPHLRSVYIFDTWYYRTRHSGLHIKQLLQSGFPENQLDSHIYPGNSQKTIPRFFSHHRHDVIDLILVDGDHNKAGVCADLHNLIDRFKVMVAHDVFNPEYPHMTRVLKQYAEDNNYLLAFCGHQTFGTAVLFNLDFTEKLRFVYKG